MGRPALLFQRFPPNDSTPAVLESSADISQILGCSQVAVLLLYLLYHRFTTDFCQTIGSSQKAALLHRFQQLDCVFIKVALLSIHQMYPPISYCSFLVLALKRPQLKLEYGWLMMGCGRCKYSCFPRNFSLYLPCQVTELLLYQRFQLMSAR